jgi:hypothetical protein
MPQPSRYFDADPPPARKPKWVLSVFIGIGAVLAVRVLLAVVIQPGLERARASGNEASAIGSLRSVASAQAAYSSACGEGFYAPTLAALGRPDSRSPGSMSYLSPDLAGPEPVVKYGDVFRVVGTPDASSPASCNGVPAGQGLKTWAVTAEPGIQGARHFALDTSGTVVESTSPIRLGRDHAPLPPATPMR